ncbi:MAG: hypothetical protein EOP28_00505 [Rhodococcus sp. (in: high G+C Gram-positive bacteria)]|nr:MAG: hypothetical protein EOP28_00505 [Rhodococcus sp. (in: high G+C Gram-positive bacteria)]
MVKRSGGHPGHPRQRALRFEDVPAKLRPSSFTAWLAEVPEHPDHDNADHVTAAYGLEPDEVAQVPRGQRPAVDPHWRTQIAAAAQWDSYWQWCDENGLTLNGSRSRRSVPREWSWTAFRRWDDERRGQ